jgi:hypothetical protein
MIEMSHLHLEFHFLTRFQKQPCGEDEVPAALATSYRRHKASHGQWAGTCKTRPGKCWNSGPGFLSIVAFWLAGDYAFTLVFDLEGLALPVGVENFRLLIKIRLWCSSRKCKGDNEWPLHASEDGCHERMEDNMCWGGCREVGVLIHCWWECRMVQPFWGAAWQFMKSLRNRVTMWPSNCVLAIYVRK